MHSQQQRFPTSIGYWISHNVKRRPDARYWRWSVRQQAQICHDPTKAPFHSDKRCSHTAHAADEHIHIGFYDVARSQNSVAGLPLKPPRSRFSRRRKHFWLILRDLFQFCAQLSRFKRRNLPIAIISCSCDQMTVIPSTFREIFPKYRLFGPFLALFQAAFFRPPFGENLCFLASAKQLKTSPPLFWGC